MSKGRLKLIEKSHSYTTVPLFTQTNHFAVLTLIPSIYTVGAIWNVSY